MCCQDVKFVREFIIAVHEYSNYMKVDVIAYSMGVAITRKALMGGSCVDTGEYLGKPLTNIVDTYLGIAGIAYGMQHCPMGLQVVNFKTIRMPIKLIQVFKFLNKTTKTRLQSQNLGYFTKFSKPLMISRKAFGFQCTNFTRSI